MSEDNTVSDAVTLARIEGKVDRINDRAARGEADMADVKTRLNGHSNRIGALETADKVDKAQRETVEKVVKLLWAIFGTILIGGIVTVAQNMDWINIGG
jgi:hypothetical protein